MPVLSPDTPIGFVWSFLWRATAVTYLTDLVCAVLRLRGRCLARWLARLLAQASPRHLAGASHAIADAILRHPMIGSPWCRGDHITGDQLALILSELAGAAPPLGQAIARALEDPATRGRLELWFDASMSRATRAYRLQSKLITAVASLAVLALTGQPSLANWLLLGLGAPFWYDVLRRAGFSLRRP